MNSKNMHGEKIKIKNKMVQKLECMQNFDQKISRKRPFARHTCTSPKINSERKYHKKNVSQKAEEWIRRASAEGCYQID